MCNTIVSLFPMQAFPTLKALLVCVPKSSIYQHYIKNMQTPYNIIIIGSGLGGLLSAVLLAKEGKKVCVLEKNNQYGGNLQTFVRNKIIFDTGSSDRGSGLGIVLPAYAGQTDND